MPFCDASVVNDSVVLVAPATFWNVAPPSVLCCHCTVGVGLPFAAAVNVAVLPAETDWLLGLVVIEGACADAELAKAKPNASRKTAVESLTMFMPSALVKDKPCRPHLCPRCSKRLKALSPALTQ